MRSLSFYEEKKQIKCSKDLPTTGRNKVEADNCLRQSVLWYIGTLVVALLLINNLDITVVGDK